MLTDPQSVTINTVATDLVKIKDAGLETTYSNSDQTLQLVVTHSTAKNGRVRTLCKLTQRKIVTNPLDSTNDYDTTTVSVQIDRPGYGWTKEQVDYVVAGLKGWLSQAVVFKLFGLEH